MLLRFKGGKEEVWLDIDRVNKILKIATSKTNYRMQQVPWNNLFDQGKEAIQDLKTRNLSDDDFKKTIEIEMLVRGYELKGD